MPTTQKATGVRKHGKIMTAFSSVWLRQGKFQVWWTKVTGLVQRRYGKIEQKCAFLGILGLRGGGLFAACVTCLFACSAAGKGESEILFTSQSEQIRCSSARMVAF